MWKCLYCLGLINIMLINPVQLQMADDLKRLLTQILTTNSYNKLVRPSEYLTNRTVVYITMHMIGITDIDELGEKMTSTAYLELGWMDSYLRWDPEDYNGIEEVFLPQNVIWKPDIALDNGFTKIKELGDPFILAKVNSNGNVAWFPYETFQTKCSVDIQYFPFDQQTCELKFGVWTSTIDEVDCGLGAKGIQMEDYQPNGEWTIVNTYSEATDSKSNGAIVTFSFVLKRKPDYYLYNLVVPIMLLSILAVFTFAIPVESGEKLGFCMTVYLAFAVFLTIVSTSLPASSTQSLLSKYLMFLLIIGTLIIMVTVIELRINFRDNSYKISGCLKGLVRFSRCLQFRKRDTKVVQVRECDPESRSHCQTSSEDDNNRTSVKQEVTYDGITWPTVVASVDFVCFWLFLFTNVFGSVAMLMSGYILSSR